MTVTLHPMPEADRTALERALVPYFAEIVTGIEPSACQPPGAAPDAAPDASIAAARQFGPGRHPFWICRGDLRVGFALAFTHADGLHELAEFTIFTDHRRTGLGQEALRRLLARLPGPWRLGVVDHGAADRFWAQALAIPEVRDLRRGPALMAAQSHGYWFTADRGDAR